MAYTRNEVIAYMHEDTASAFRKLADHLEQNPRSLEEAIEFMREIADEKEAQAIVVKLRDDINNY